MYLCIYTKSSMNVSFAKLITILVIEKDTRKQGIKKYMHMYTETDLSNPDPNQTFGWKMNDYYATNITPPQPLLGISPPPHGSWLLNTAVSRILCAVVRQPLRIDRFQPVNPFGLTRLRLSCLSSLKQKLTWWVPKDKLERNLISRLKSIIFIFLFLFKFSKNDISELRKDIPFPYFFIHELFQLSTITLCLVDIKVNYSA